MRVIFYNLSLAKEERGVSWSKLAKQAGTSPSVMSMIRGGRMDATPAQRRRLARALNCDEQWLFDTSVPVLPPPGTRNGAKEQR